MSHHIYRTNAVVLNTRSFRESDLLVTFLTEEMGVVRAVAVSARKESSRLRYGLQTLTHVNLSLVRGKAFWRVTGVHILEGWQTPLKRENREKVRRIAKLIDTFVIEEDPALIQLYAIFVNAVEAIANETEDTVCSMYELFAVLEILFELGYVDKTNAPMYLGEASFTREHALMAMPQKKELLNVINSGISASHL